MTRANLHANPLSGYSEDAPDRADALGSALTCPTCGILCSPNVEAFEAFDELVCDECAEALFETAAEDDGQPDEAQEWADHMGGDN